MRALLDHQWPGNIRELINVVQYAFAVGRGPELTLQELPPEFRAPSAPAPTPALPVAPQASPSSPRPAEATRIRQALAHSGGNIGQAAKLLGVSRPTFWRKRKKHGI